MISPLLTDLYQFTMAYGYWKLNMHERESVFHLIFRRNPFNNAYSVAAGLGDVIDFLKAWRFSADDLAYLQSLKSPTGKTLFTKAFLQYLKKLRFTGDVEAVPEGTIVFPHEPLLRIKAPLIQGQLLESTLLNIVNFQTLIATKASRVRLAAGEDSVFEFGLRRAQGPDGALSASRASYIGGCDATSNVLAGKCYGIPVRGTHAHSWVTAFEDEKSAFEGYAKVMPHNCTLLVDTYQSIDGVKRAIEVGKILRKEGFELRGIRLDSGDLTRLSIEARTLLDEAGFKQTNIIASNSLDEYVIAKMKQQGAKVNIWGVGTNLVTAYDHPALDGVYKLSALRDEKGEWHYKLKLSEQAVKVSNPGIYQVRRFFLGDQLLMDVMYDEPTGIDESPVAVSLQEPHEMTSLETVDAFCDLLQPVFRKGKCIYSDEPLSKMRERAMSQIKQFMVAGEHKPYPVMLEKKLHELKQQLIADVSEINIKKQ